MKSPGLKSKVGEITMDNELLSRPRSLETANPIRTKSLHKFWRPTPKLSEPKFGGFRFLGLRRIAHYHGHDARLLWRFSSPGG